MIWNKKGKTEKKHRQLGIIYPQALFFSVKIGPNYNAGKIYFQSLSISYQTNWIPSSLILRPLLSGSWLYLSALWVMTVNFFILKMPSLIQNLASLFAQYNIHPWRPIQEIGSVLSGFLPSIYHSVYDGYLLEMICQCWKSRNVMFIKDAAE